MQYCQLTFGTVLVGLRVLGVGVWGTVLGSNSSSEILSTLLIVYSRARSIDLLFLSVSYTHLRAHETEADL
eukprot:4572376-Amphidinium_carterae.1